MWRWTLEERDDILEWVSVINCGTYEVYDFPIHPVIKDEVTRCPFLRKVRNQSIYICRINDTKPEDCQRFPVSVKQAKEIGCPGMKQ